MHGIYNFITGPLAWISWSIFILGCLYRLVSLTLSAKSRDDVVLNYFNLKYALRSILHWMIPFGSVNMRKHPIMTIVSFSFHICLLITPIFLLAHEILWEEFFGISFWTIPDKIADIMTMVVMGGCLFFAIRRMIVKEVKFVTFPSDYFLLILVASPFVFGFLAYHQWFDYQWMLILHILSAELVLALIPFTRLVHMIFAPLVRAYTGSEFGGVRHARDW
jgi:nitrate reductase gamma subunit